MKKRNLFMSATLMCGLFCVAFKFDHEGLHWLWSDQKQGAVVLAILTIVLAVFWYSSAPKSPKGDFR